MTHSDNFGSTPFGGSSSGGSPFGAPPSGSDSGNSPGGFGAPGGGHRPVDFSSGAAPAQGQMTFGGPPAPTAAPTSAPSDVPVADLTPVTGPWAFVGTAAATAVAGVLLGIAAPLTGSATDNLFHTLAIIGWALAGIVTFILLGIHTAKDTKRQAESFYVGTPSQKTVYRAAVVFACIGVIITAGEIALWISKTVGA
ncbi:MAG: hypothetical protein ACTH1D_01755 [Mycobacteriaceae bacterium]|uniref:hypothetical protein n=1 Tax=Corynebacterium variabile TaxID=1727 RepID=UPI003FB69A8F